MSILQKPSSTCSYTILDIHIYIFCNSAILQLVQETNNISLSPKPVLQRYMDTPKTFHNLLGQQTANLNATRPRISKPNNTTRLEMKGQ